MNILKNEWNADGMGYKRFEWQFKTATIMKTVTAWAIDNFGRCDVTLILHERWIQFSHYKTKNASAWLLDQNYIEDVDFSQAWQTE